MPIEKSRAEYLQALLNQKNQLNKSDNSGLLNPGVSNELETQAMVDTNFNNKTSVNDITDERKFASSNTDNDNWFVNLINKANGFLTNISNAFLEGVGSAFEGIIDLGASAIGSLGEWTGWYDSKPYSEFIEHNYAKDFADFNTDVLGNGLPGVVNMVRNTIEYGGDYWKDAFTDVSNVKNKYHQGLYSDTLTPNREVENGFEEFSMGVAQSIGMMLPSIVIPGGAGLSGVAAKGVSLGIMGAGAAGKGSEEAINEGASIDQAFGYGALSGGIEVASELVVGKALGAVGLGTGKVMGVIGGKETVKVGSKAFIKELAKDMFEEGMEEVFSAVLEPLTKATYKGSSALDQYKSMDYWLGTNGHFNESVLGQFTSGAVTSGIMGGTVRVVNKATVTSKVGKEGYQVVNKWQEILQNDAELQKAKKGSADYNRLNENNAKLWAEFMELEDKFISNGNNTQIKNMAQILGNPNEYAKYITTDEETTNNDLKSYLKELQNNSNTFEKRITRDYFNDVQNRYGTDYKLEFGKVDNDNYAYVDKTNKVIKINDSIVNEKGGALLAHEYFGHVLGDSLSSGTRSMLYNSIKGTEWYQKIEKELVKEYQINDEYYQKLDNQKAKNNYYQDEVIAKYLEEVFGNKDTADSIKHLKKVFSQPTLLDRVLSVFNKSKSEFNTPNIVKEYAKVINNTIDALYSLNKNNSLLKALFKEKNGYKLTENENKLKAEYKNLFELVYSKKTDNLKGNVNKDTNVTFTLTYGNGQDDYNVRRNKTLNVSIDEFLKRVEKTTENRWNLSENVRVEINVINGNKIIDTNTFTDYKELRRYARRLYKLQQETIKAENSKTLNNQETVDLSQEKNEVGKEKTKSSPNTYKSMETTKDIIELLKTRIAGDNFNLSFPKTYRDFVNRTFSELNKVKDINKTVDRIMNLLKETTVEYFDEEQNKYVKLSTMDVLEFADPKAWTDLKHDVKRLIQYATETKAKSRETLQYEKTINRLNDKVKEYGDRINNVRKISNKLTRIKKNVGHFFDFTDDEIARNGLNELYKPFAKLKPGEKGFKVLELKDQINDILEWYNEDTISSRFETLPYNDKIRTALEDLYESLGTPVEITTKTGREIKLRGNLSVDELKQINDILELVATEIRNMTTESVDNKTYARASYDSLVAARKDLNGFKKIIKSWKRGFAPSYTLIREMFGGNSSMARLLTTDMQQATNDNIMYKGGYNDALTKKIKELGIKKNIFTKKVKINGYEMTYDQALYLYISLNTETNFNEIDKVGFQYGYEKDKYTKTIGIGEAQTFKDEVENTLPDNLKKLGDYIQTSINTEIKQDYIKWYEKRYGKFEGRNELGKIGEKSYWMLNRSYQFATSAEKVVKTPAGVFKNSISRVNSDNAIMLGGALSSYTTYIDRLGTEIYLKPLYRQVFQILNTKVNGTTLYKELVRTGATDEKYLMRTLNDMIGVRDNGNADMLTKMMSAFSVAKLSLNVGSMMKQFASIYTSNIPLRKSAKAIITRMFNSEAKTEFRKLVDEIGGLKYREGTQAVVTANTGTLNGRVKDIADFGMYGIKKIDYFTIGTGVYSLMVIGQDQYGYKIGTEQNIKFVKEHWTEFELSQIGSSALSQSGISRGDYGGSLTRAVFSFMQGANRAAFGSIINKIGLYNRNKNLNKTTLQSDVNKYKKLVEEIETDSKYLDENKKFDVSKITDEQVREDYINKKSELMKAEDKLKDYINYEIVNGNSKFGIPTQIVSGLIAQGIFVALINEVMKHIKGKKDWDEWDVAELGANMTLAASLDWLPFVNVIENMFKGYDVQVPAIEIMNELKDVINNAQNGNWRTAIREFALLLGDSTGIPFKTIYDYIYGAIKPFNPAIAYEMNSVLYGSSSNSALTTFKTYVEKKDLSKSTEIMNIMMNDYRVKSNDVINKELSRLYMNGYTDVLPKNYMIEYTDDKGNKVSLTAKQIETFRKYYNEATSSVKELMNVIEYKNMTDEEKSKVIKKIYDSYYSMAKAKLLNTKADSKLGNYLSLSKQNAKIGQISLVLSKINTITDSKTKTRKELVFDYVNKLSGFSKGEKLLLLYLCNYTSQANSNILKAYLRNNNGMSMSEINEFLR